MEYSKLLHRSWDILLKQKYLIILGVLAALGSPSGNNSSWQSSGGDSGEESLPAMPADGFDFENLPFEQFDWLWLLPVAGLIALIGFAVVIGIVIWIIGNLARGGLVAGVHQYEQGEPLSFGQAWSAAWAKVWRLLGISLIPAIPMLIFLVLGIGVFISTVGLAAANFEQIDFEQIGAALGVGFFSLFLCFVCLLIPILIVLEFLRIFAVRACMLEDTGVFDSYRRSIQVIRENGTEFIALFLLRVGVGIALFVILFLPGMVMTFCCVLWPLLLLVQGFIMAYFSTMWTLAWREWTGLPPAAPDLTDAPMEV